MTEDSNIAIAASALAVAALFRPVRASTQHFHRSAVLSFKYDAAATLDRFATRARDEVDMEALTGELFALVSQTLQPSTARLWLQGADSAG